MYAVGMFLKTLWNSHGGFYFRSRFLCFKRPIKNIGTLSVQELFFQLIGWLGVELGVSPVGMVYFMG